jgi:hypothetical protein
MRNSTSQILNALTLFLLPIIFGCSMKQAEENSALVKKRKPDIGDSLQADSLPVIPFSNQLNSDPPVLMPAIQAPRTKQTLEENIIFLEEHLLNEKRGLVPFYISKYHSCDFLTHDSTELQDFCKINVVHDVNGDGNVDTVFVLPPFDMCEDGDSYYFGIYIAS